MENIQCGGYYCNFPLSLTATDYVHEKFQTATEWLAFAVIWSHPHGRICAPFPPRLPNSIQFTLSSAAAIKITYCVGFNAVPAAMSSRQTPLQGLMFGPCSISQLHLRLFTLFTLHLHPLNHPCSFAVVFKEWLLISQAS